MEREPLEIPARDGFGLAATRFRPAPEQANGAVVVINPATAVRQRLYAAYARYLAEAGFCAITYDYRGIGASSPQHLRGFEATMQMWGRRDIAGVLDWVRAEHQPTRLLVVGHSAGGQLVGLADNNAHIDAMLAISVQSGYWRLFDAPERYRLSLFWYAVLPGLAHAFGYLPARRLGLGENLPKGVLLEWARWCRTPAYLMGDPHVRADHHFDAFEGPIRAYSFADDAMAPAPAVEALLALYTRAQITRRHVAPAEVGLDALGHFGFFRPKSQQTLWPETLAWLRAQAA